MTTLEQKARDILERMDIEDAQSMTAGDVLELANLLNRLKAAEAVCIEIEEEITDDDMPFGMTVKNLLDNWRRVKEG